MVKPLNNIGCLTLKKGEGTCPQRIYLAYKKVEKLELSVNVEGKAISSCKKQSSKTITRETTTKRKKSNYS